MFGTFRTILALFVVDEHMYSQVIIGEYAVFGFFILSGYLMTLIMHSTYGYSFKGIKAFFINRFLRIYPVYWMACLISIALILIAKESAVIDFKKQIQIPNTVASFLQNFFIVLSVKSPIRLIPPAWALSTELFYYVLIGIGASRNRTITFIWLTISVAYIIFTKIAGLGWHYRYFYLPAGSLPFSTGALIYHYREKIAGISIFRNKFVPIIFLGLVIINFTFGLYAGTLHSYNAYINFGLQAIIVASLTTKNITAFISPKLDKFIGNLSYPMYLLHYQAGFIVAMLGLGNRGNLIFLLSTVIVLFFMSWITAILSDAFIEKLRSRVKTQLKSPSTVLESPA